MGFRIITTTPAEALGRYRLSNSLRDVGDHFGISHEKARQLIQAAERGAIRPARSPKTSLRFLAAMAAIGR